MDLEVTHFWMTHFMIQVAAVVIIPRTCTMSPAYHELLNAEPRPWCSLDGKE